MKKAPCIDVRTDVHKDVRFEVLGELAGYNRYEALGRMHALWSWCRDRGLQDTRDGIDGYVVTAPVVRRFLGSNGLTAILGDGCDDFALAEELADGTLYLRGTSEYIAAARKHAATSSAGGAARAAAATSRDQGRFVSEPTNVQPEHQPPTSQTPAGAPAADQPQPASSSSLFPLSDQITHTRARERHPSAGPIARRVWQHAGKLSLEIKAENIHVPPWPHEHGPDHSGWVALLDRVCELLVSSNDAEAERIAMNRVNVASAKARADAADAQWFSATAMFTRKSFDAWAHLDPASIGRKQQRAGPRRSTDLIGSAPPRDDHPVSATLIPITEL